MKISVTNQQAFLRGCVKSSHTDQENLFPKHWGNPPKIQTCDYVEWPAGYGWGSSTVKHWIEKNIALDEAGR